MAAPPNLRLSEREHVEEPLMRQLETMPGGLWKVQRLEMGAGQTPGHTGRSTFDDVLLLPQLCDALRRINPWIDDAGIAEAIADLTTHGTGTLVAANERASNLLTKGAKVSHDTGEGRQGRDAAFIDFTTPANNTFLAVSQLKLRVPGTDKHVYPDVVLFVNGIPVVVIECKSPHDKEPIPSAIDQLMRYCGQRGHEQPEGVKPLFCYNQFIIATSRQVAKFGTITTGIEKHFYRWTDPFPEDLNEVAKYCRPQQQYFTDAAKNDEENTPLKNRTLPNDQQRLVHGMLKPENLLSIIRTFAITTTTDDGKLIKVVGRYQQLRAVKKAVARLLNGKNRDERGGIVWHTQGSGKSLTMVFLIREMFLHAKLMAYKIVLLTDRTQLDEQIAKTARGAGFTIKSPADIASVKTALKTDTSEIVSVMIHKFGERDFDRFPRLNESEKILLLIDEAHRSQYTRLGANLDNALPNATRIAFTGTPIQRTENTFRDYIDKYTMRQAIEDGVTLEIVYEGRTHDAAVEDEKGANALFQDVFKDYNIAEQVEIIGYGTRRAYLESMDTIADKARDMLKHYSEQVLPNGYKAQVVCISKEAAHRYRLAFEQAIPERISALEAANPDGLDIERLKALKTAVVISDVDHNAAPELKEYANGGQRTTATAGFKLPFGKTEKGKREGEAIDGNIGILIAVDMLLTGFDAPIEQVMYLDKVIVNHNLLQAIARVNRVYDDTKKAGFVVDYVGMGAHMKRALEAYFDKEQQEMLDCLVDPSELEIELKNAHAALIKVFEEGGLAAFSDPDDIYNLLSDENVRQSFAEAYDAFAKAMDNMYPRKEALHYLDDLNRFSEVQTLAAQYFRDARLSMKGVSEKLRRVTDAYLKSRGITVKVEPISILDERFFEHVNTHARTQTKAAAVEHAVRHFIDVRMDEDPELYASFAEELRSILANFREQWDVIYGMLEELRAKIKAAQTENTYGLNRKTQMPIFRKLHGIIWDKDTALNDDQISLLAGWTKEIYGMLRTELRFIGFWGNVASVSRLKSTIANFIAEQYNYCKEAFPKRETIAQEIVAWAKDERNHAAIYYAED